MRCDICITLNSEYRKVSVLLRMATSNKWKRSAKAANFTAIAYRQQVVSRRKHVIFELFGTYKSQRIKEAAKRNIQPTQISIDSIVPDSEVKTARFVFLLNKASGKRKDATYRPITEADVHVSEILQLDEVAAQYFLDGQLGDDLSVGPQDDEVESDSSASDDEDDEPGGEDIDVDDLDAVSKAASEAVKKLLAGDKTATTRRRLGLLSAVETLVARRRYHNEHVT